MSKKGLLINRLDIRSIIASVRTGTVSGQSSNSNIGVQSDTDVKKDQIIRSISTNNN